MVERKTVSQCVSEDYCKGWNDAVDAMGNNEYRYETGFIKGFEAAQPKWISVEDRLPKGGSMVIAHMAYFYEVLQWDAKTELWFSAHSIHAKPYVTHWMPLPEPPNEDAHE